MDSVPATGSADVHSIRDTSLLLGNVNKILGMFINTIIAK